MNDNASTLTIVMYHYVRDLPHTRHPRIKGLLTSDFQGQLDYLERHYALVPMSAVMAAVRGEAVLPPKACLLTFDDGFSDHYATVWPILRERRLSAAFFPPARAVEEREILDVHKLHFVLASAPDTENLVRTTLQLVAEHRSSYDLPEDRELWANYATASRFDPPEIVFIKRLLQHGLPPPVRGRIVADLFTQYVSHDARSFADELYLTVSQLREMIGAGMEIGGHGYRHDWLEHQTREQQAEEIGRTRRFLEQLHGTSASRAWAMCYAYGSYNTITLELLAEVGCVLGFTTHVGVNHDLCRPLELARLDTNDLPRRADG